jgi:hypothetical protein
VPGTVHTLTDFDQKKSAPRVMHEVTGDFSVEVRVTSDFNPGREAAEGVAARGRSSYNGAGLLLWDSIHNFIRLERNVWVTSNGSIGTYTPLFEHWRNNRGSGSVGNNTPFYEFSYLRMTRQGQKFQPQSAPMASSGLIRFDHGSVPRQNQNWCRRHKLFETALHRRIFGVQTKPGLSIVARQFSGLRVSQLHGYTSQKKTKFLHISCNCSSFIP